MLTNTFRALLEVKQWLTPTAVADTECGRSVTRRISHNEEDGQRCWIQSRSHI